MVYSMFCTSYLVVSDFSCVLRGPCSRKLVLAPITLLLFNSPCPVLLQGFKGMVTRSALALTSVSMAPLEWAPYRKGYLVIKIMKCYLFSPSFGWEVNGCDKAPCHESYDPRTSGGPVTPVFFWILSSSPSDGSRQRVWVCPLGMEVASYPRVIWNFITENIVRYIDFQKSPLILLYLYPLLKPKMGQKCEHGSSARKTWSSYCASPILSWDGVRNTIWTSVDKVVPILTAARCWIGLGKSVIWYSDRGCHSQNQHFWFVWHGSVLERTCWLGITCFW